MMSYDHNFTGLDLVAGQKMMLYVVCIELKYNIVLCRYQVLVLTVVERVCTIVITASNGSSLTLDNILEYSVYQYSSTDTYRMHVLFQISKQSTDNQRHRKIEYRTRIVASNCIREFVRAIENMMCHAYIIYTGARSNS